jgi:two-component system cell cycle sensor histidine kinase/response regulator CckA
MTKHGAVVPTDAELPSPLRTSPSADVRYRELFEGALLGVYVSQPGGRLLACNAAFVKMLGFDSDEDAVGTNMSALYGDHSEREAFLRHLREHGRLEHHRARLRRRDGQAIDVIETVVGEFDEAHALVELRGFLLNVTATVEADRARHERERQFRAVFVDAADAMVILDDVRVILEANPAACRLFGMTSDIVVGRTLDSVLVDDAGELAAAWRELLAFGEARREHRVRADAQGPRLMECSYRARVSSSRHLCIARDITDRRLLEERLTQSEKIESVGRLAGGIAHDFNNLLTAILGYAEMLLASHSAEGDPDRRDLEEIQRAGERAAALTQQLLAFSRKQVLVPKDVDLNNTIETIRGLLVRLIREDITLSCDLASTPAAIRIDPTQLEQAILNLVLNARDALPAGGEIRLEVAHVRRSQMDVPADLPAGVTDYVRLRVVDDGVGISPAIMPHLFEPFFTTKEVGKGTGLGLASVYGIVRQSNGVISVESEPGRGSVFTMHFPAVTPTAPLIDSRSIKVVRRSRGNETILLVEDEESVRVLVGSVLRRQGYRVFEAPTPKAAWEIFERHAAEIDLVVSDVIMPEMSGPALAQRLVGVRPELRILFISGYADIAMPIDVGSQNVSFLNKPFQASALTARVRKMLSSARA